MKPRILIVAILVMAGTAVYLFLKPQANTTPPQDTNTPQAAISTEGWIPYTNKKYGLSFNYPINWNIIPLNDEALYSSLSLFNYDTTAIESAMDHGILDIQKFGKSILKIEVAPQLLTFPTELTLETGNVHVNNESEYVAVNSTTGNNEVEISKDVTVGNLKGYQVNYKNSPYQLFDYATHYYIFPKGKVVIISVLYKGVNTEPFSGSLHEALSDTILSTFKFE